MPAWFFSGSVEDRPALAVDLQHFAGAVERRRELFALLRIGRKARDQRLDFPEQRVAAGIERGAVERRIAIEALEAIAGEHRAERRWDRYPTLGIEPQCVVGHEAVHDVPGSPLPVAPALSECKPNAPTSSRRVRSWAPLLRMGCYGLSWDHVGVNQPPGRPRAPANRVSTPSLIRRGLKEWLRGSAGGRPLEPAVPDWANWICTQLRGGPRRSAGRASSAPAFGDAKPERACPRPVP